MAQSIESTRSVMADEYDRVQKKTFTKWVNTHLMKAGMKVNDLYEDFSDGIKLITLLELLTKEKLPREKGKMRIHKRQNVLAALMCLEKHKVKLVGITSDHIVDGNKKLILGLVWTLILHFQLSGGGEDKVDQREVKRELLEWAQTAVEPYEIQVTNFTSSWSDGTAFCAILHRHRPDILDYTSQVDEATPLENLQLAFDTAQDQLAVEKLLDPEDVCVANPDEKSILTYVSFLRTQFPVMPPAPKLGPSVSMEDFEQLHGSLLGWALSKTKWVKQRDFPSSLEGMKGRKAELQKYLSQELPVKTREKAQLAEMEGILMAKKGAAPIPAHLSMDKLNQVWAELSKETDECKVAMDEEIRRMEELAACAAETEKACDEGNKQMDKMEGSMDKLEKNLSQMDPENRQKAVSALRQQVEELEAPVAMVKDNEQKLEEGRYWDMDTVKPKVDAMVTRYDALKQRLFDLEENERTAGRLQEKMADLHKRFQTVLSWKTGKDFAATKDEKKAFLDGANEEYVALMSEEGVQDLNPGQLTSQRDSANRHWEDLCKMQDSEEQAEQTLVKMKDLLAWTAGNQSDLDSQAPLASTLEGVKKQKEWHTAFVTRLNEKKPEIMKYAHLSVKCQSQELMLSVKGEHKALGKQWAQLSRQQEEWGKVLDCCIATWEKGLAVRDGLRDLEEWLSKWGPPADNQAVLVQYTDVLMFLNDRVEPFRAEVAEMNVLKDQLVAQGGHPPVIEICDDVNQRFDWLTASVDTRCDRTDNCCKVATEFDEVLVPLQEWVAEATSDVKRLFPLDTDKERLELARERLLSIQNDARGKEPTMDTLSTLATQFAEKREPIKKEIASYHSKLKSLTPPPVAMETAQNDTSAQAEGDASIEEQAVALKIQWEWILKQSIERKEVVEEVVRQLEEFETQHAAVSQFMVDGQQHLAKEKPIGGTPQKIKEQLDACKSFRSAIDEKQTDVDAMLSLGRTILTSPHTSADDQPFEKRLTDSIEQWSDLQLGWQNWYHELMAATEKSSAASDRYGSFSDWLALARSKLDNTFPLKVGPDSAPADVEEAQATFDAELVEPCERQQEVVDALRAEVGLLDNPEKAMKELEEFEQFSTNVKNKRKRLFAAADWAGRYDASKPPVYRSLETLERKLAEGKPLPSTEEGFDDLLKEVAALEREKNEKAPAVEDLLKILEEVDGLSDAMEPQCFQEERADVGRRWERVKDEIQKRQGWAKDAKDQLSSYSSQKEPFQKWLTAAEADKKRLKKVPKSRRKMKKYRDNLQQFYDDVNAHGDDLKAVQDRGQAFVNTAKEHDAGLEDYKRFLSEVNPAILEPLHTGSTPKKGAKDVGADSVTKELANLQARYDALKNGTDSRKLALDAAHDKRQQADVMVEELMPLLDQLEQKCGPLMADGPAKVEPEEIEEEVALADSCQLECASLMPKMETLSGAALDWFGTRDQDKVDDAPDGVSSSGSEDDDDLAAEEKELKERLARLKDAMDWKKARLEDSLSNAGKLYKDLSAVESWLEPMEKKCPEMQPAAVRSTPLQQQVKEVEDFSSKLSAFQPEMDRLSQEVSRLAPSDAAAPDPPMVTKYKDCVQRFGKLKTDAASRMQMLSDFEPKVEEIEAGLKSCDSQVTVWEKQAEELKAMDTAVVENLRKQAEEIRALKAAVEALEQAKWAETQEQAKEVITSNIGPFGEVLSPTDGEAPPYPGQQHSEGKKSKSKKKKGKKKRVDSSGSDSVPVGPETGVVAVMERPGKAELVSDVEGLNERIEELKKLVALKEKEVAEKLKKAEEYHTLGQDLSEWLGEKETEADEALPVKELSSGPLLGQVETAKKLKAELQDREKDKDHLKELFDDLTSSLRDDHPDKQCLGEPCDDISKRWDALTDRLNEKEPQLAKLAEDAETHESDYGELCDWLGPAEESAAAMATVPSELDAVQEQLKALEDLECQMCEHQPQLESCCTAGSSLSEACEDTERKEEMDKKIAALQDRWGKLGGGVKSAKDKLARAAGQGAELDGIVGGVLDWIDGVNKTLRSQEPIGVRTPLIDKQIEDHKSLMAEVHDHRPDVEKAQAVGKDILRDLEGKEHDKMAARLKGLTFKYTDLDDMLTHRYEELEQAKEKAANFEGRESTIDSWLEEKEKVLQDWDVLPVDSASLEQRMDKIGDLDHQVTSYFPTVVELFRSEESLLGSELEAISAFESAGPEGQAKVHFTGAKGDQEHLPAFMLRPGAQEVVDEAADLRRRYEALKKQSTHELNEVADLLAKVQKYETDHERFCDWLNDKKRDVGAFGPIPATPVEVEEELRKLLAMKDEFTEKAPELDAVQSLGSELADYSGTTTSSEALRAKLGDTNSTWKELLDALDRREADLTSGRDRARDYHDKLGEFMRWLKTVEAELEEPEKTAGDPRDIAKQLTKGICADTSAHEPALAAILKAAAALEESSGPDIDLGEREAEERFRNAENKSKGRSVSLGDTLAAVGKADKDLSSLIQALEEIHDPLASHEPIRVKSDDVQQQLAQLQDLAAKYESLQPEVAAAVTAAEVFAVPAGDDDRDGATSTGSSALSDSLPVGQKEKKPKSKKAKKGPPSSPSAGRKRRSLDDERGRKGAEQKDGASSPKAGSKKLRSPARSPSRQAVPTSPSAAFDNGSSAFAEMAPSVPSGPYLHNQLEKLKSLNDDTKSLLDDWQTRAASGLEDALKFEEDYDSLYQWVEGKKEEADELGPIGVTEAKIMEQIAAVEALQAAVDKKRPEVQAVNDAGGSLCKAALPADVDYVQEKLEKLNADIGALDTTLHQRRAFLQDSLGLAAAYRDSLAEAQRAITEKQAEVAALPPVGMDIETVQAQLEECKSLEEDVNALKEKLSTAQDCGKKVTVSCSDADVQKVNGELQELAGKWNAVNTVVYTRKHQLEDALLQLGQFHDALAELLEWIGTESSALVNADPPGVEEDTINRKIQDLEAVKSEVEAREKSVQSVTEAAGQLISSGASDNASNIQHDIQVLASNWDALHTQCAAREKELEQALEKAKSFHGNRKAELDWLDGAERNIVEMDKVHGLPNTCAKDLEEFEFLEEEIACHAEPVQALEAEGDSLKPQGNVEEQQQVKNWTGVVKQRYDDLLCTLSDRKDVLDKALFQANEFDELYNDAMKWMGGVYARLKEEGPIHSELEEVKQQLEDHKELQKELDDYEPKIDEVVGCGQLLCRQCVPEDAEVIQKKLEELQAQWDLAKAEASQRQSDLEEALLALGQFQDAYDELMRWLEEAEEQLNHPEPITGNPDQVATLQSKHKVFQKQLGARNSSLNSVMKAGQLLMKQKEGEDAEILQDKLEKAQQMWDDVCQKSVDQQQKLQDTNRKLGEFRGHLVPLYTWLGRTLPKVDEGEPVHGDVGTVAVLADIHANLLEKLATHREDYEMTKACAQDLLTNYLDDPTETEADLSRLQEQWDLVNDQAASKQARLDEAAEMAALFEGQYNDLLEWMDNKLEFLTQQPPPSDNPVHLEKQIEQQKAFVAELNAKHGDLDTALDCGRQILDLAHLEAVPIVQGKIHELDKKWSKLKTAAGERSEELATALLEMKGLQDMLDKLVAWVDEAETWMDDKDQEPVEEDLEMIEQQLAEHEAFQEQMANHQPDMDALSKAEKAHKGKGGKHSAHDLDKKIRSLHKRWQKLWMRMSERHRLLLEGKTRTQDVATAKSFDFETWRRRFNQYVDRNKLRLKELFRNVDSNHDGNLTRDELMKALRASGMPTSAIELNKVALVLDQKKIGVYNIDKVIEILRPEKVKPKPEPATDAEKIAVEIDRQVSHCCCAKRYQVSKVAEGKYRFGETQQLRLVRILRSTVMVRVGGGWEPLDAFLLKHDPCRAAGRTNQELKKYLGTVDASPGSLAMAGFRTSAQTEIKAKHDERARKSATPERILSESPRDSPGTSPPVDDVRTKPSGKPPVSRTRQPSSKQGTPERVMPSPKQKNGSIPSATKHILPRQSPKREGGGAQRTQQTTHVPSHKATREISSVAVDAHVKGGRTVVGTVTKTTDKVVEESGDVIRKTTFRGSKSPSPHDPQPKSTATAKLPTTPSTAKQPTTPSSAKSRLPQPSSSRIPTPGSAGKSRHAGK